MASRRRCPVCGSKQWHKEPSSGLIICSEGHVLQNYRNETREVTELGPHALRKRTLKSSRKKKEKQSKADPNLYHGERARYHYFQCLQLILRMQAAALTKAWGLPPEFEIVCRDVWALHLGLLPNPPPTDPLDFREDENDSKAPKAEHPAQRMLPADDASDGELRQNDDTEDPAPASDSSSSEDELDDDPEMAELMRENSETSSSSEDEDAPKVRHNAVGEATKKKRPRRQYDAPASNIAVLMEACWTLRLPVTYMDFIRLIEAYKLPYLDPIRLLPTSLTEHLTKHTSRALSPQHAPTPISLHELTSRLAKLMYSSYGIHTPEMNVAPILWRTVRALCGTPTLYVLTKKVARVLSVPVMLHRSLASPLPRVKKRDPGWHKYDNAVPEVSLVSVVIVVLKMIYGLDDKDRLPKEKDDPACALPRLSDFLAAIENLDKTHQDSRSFSATSHVSILDFDDTQLDKYLDFCETALLPSEDRKQERNAVMDFFHVKPRPAPHGDDNLRPEADLEKPCSALSATPLEEDDSILRPGEAYAIYNTLDVLGSLPERYETVVRWASHWSGVSEDYVAGVVERFERRLLRWWDGVRRREREERLRNRRDSGTSSTGIPD